MKKINWKVRLKNKAFWLTIIPAILTVIYAILNLVGIIPVIEKETLLRAVYALFSILSVLGIVIDPTTKGVGDSERALGYEEPYDDNAQAEEEGETDEDN